MINFLKNKLFTVHQNGKQHVSEVFKYIGPGIIVTVGFIDPGNWAANLAAGASYGYELLWVVTLSTLMLILLQHNVAHLGIVRGQCLAECAYEFLPKWLSRTVLSTAGIAAVATALAEFIGAAIALKMLFGIPLVIGSVLMAIVCTIMLITNSYSKLERIIAGFVSLIALAYLVEVNMVDVNWAAAGIGWVNPSIPNESMLVILSILGAVVMPHNLFLHSEIVQSREIHLEGDERIQHMLKYEFIDTLFSMIVGWAINSAMILLAATTFFAHNQHVEELSQAQAMLQPLLGNNAANIFAIALLLAGISSTITSGMAAGSIFSGLFGESYNAKDTHSIVGIVLSLGIALLIIFFIGDPFKGLIISQMFLSVQLPFTVFLQVGLTSSKRVMGKYANSKANMMFLYLLAGIVTFLNIWLLIESFS